jgi:hypothetical protein
VVALPPGPVQNLSAVNEGEGLFSVSWSEPLTGGLATQYRVTSPFGTQTTTGLAADFENPTGLLGRTFTVVAINAYGTGPGTSVQARRNGGTGGPCGDGTVLQPGQQCP